MRDYPLNHPKSEISVSSINAQGIALIILFFAIFPILSAFFSEEKDPFMRPLSGLFLSAYIGIIFLVISPDDFLFILIVIGTLIGYFLSALVPIYFADYRRQQSLKSQPSPQENSPIKNFTKTEDPQFIGDIEDLYIQEIRKRIAEKIRVDLQAEDEKRKSHQNPPSDSAPKSIERAVAEGSMSDYLQKRREERRERALAYIGKKKDKVKNKQ